MSGMLSKKEWAVCIALGALAGFSLFTFYYAKGWSYLSNDPKACMNCHVMREQYESWNKSSHHHSATCNDCHTPHQPALKMLAKARNGWNHSKAFTLQNYPDPIRITPHNLVALQHNCVACHATTVGDIVAHKGVDYKTMRCTECHRSVGHMSLD